MNINIDSKLSKKESITFAMKFAFIFMILLPISLKAQEVHFKAALDSISNYMPYTKSEEGRPYRLITYYSPTVLNSMSEETDSTIFISMTQNVKTCVVFSDGIEIYMANLNTMDTTLVSLGRSAIRFSDLSGKVKFKKSYSSRIFNGKHGGIETEYFLITMDLTTDEQKENGRKLIYFINQAIVYSN